ncbi:hypothetical protein E4T56_gene18267 [Termitomyces sp. T112]|nr:hypothetical protein E4T56_gene18267 [Termitomyces sp. T112]
MEEEQKRKEFEALEIKKNFENHFRKRGKRRHPEPAAKDVDPSKPDSKDHPVKKARFDNNSTEAEYGKQLRTFENRQGMKDTGIGVRPLVR